MRRPSPRQLTLLLAFAATFAVAMAFAGFTGHVWEDYFITFRSSKHLATGQGLVFNPGEKLHTFTSPIGVLLPAAASLLTGNQSDAAALWLFRVMCATALGGTSILLLLLLRGRRFAPVAIGFAIAWLGLDAKILDFTINGMETAFMLLFLAYAWWAHFHPGRRSWLHLGAAWAGLMWTRPDSFIYVALIAAGVWLFNGTGRTRRQLLLLYMQAGLVTSALYLPWILWATAYYGTPIPHTITAKAGIGDPRTAAGLILTLIKLPWLAWNGAPSLEGTFLPSYYMIGGWPQPLIVGARILAITCSLLWLIPGVNRLTRAASFSYFGAHVYLTYFPYFPFPWYLPSTALLAIIAVAGLVSQAADKRRAWAVVAGLGAAGLLACSVWQTGAVARQVRAQQRLVEDGNRRLIGEWLRAHAEPGDTVFLEPLGYIGYFSNLKTYDYPGMSSREMVEARAELGPQWSQLIQYLQPKWLVLRPQEAAEISTSAGLLLDDNYRQVGDFDVSRQVAALDVRGRPYLQVDSVFRVYRLNRPTRHDAGPMKIISPFGISYTTIDQREVMFVHAPGSVTVKVPAKAGKVEVLYGFTAPAIDDPGPTNGAAFIVELLEGNREIVLHQRILRPTTEPADRGIHRVEIELPTGHKPGYRLRLRTDPLQNMDKDWTCWSKPVFY